MKNRMQTGLICAATVTAAALHGAVTWDYSAGSKTLTVNVSSGTGSFEADDARGTYRGYLTSNAVTNFVKTGAGGFYADINLVDFVGHLTVAEGTYTFTTPNALGYSWSGKGDVRVLHGATLNSHRLVTATKDDWGDGGCWLKRIYFEGSGVNGTGALVYTSEEGAPQVRMHFSNNLVMTGDATIYNAASDALRLYGTSYYHANMDMGGHTLTLDGATVGWGWSCCTMSNPGNIIVRNQRLRLENAGSQLNGTAENVLSFADGGSISFSDFGGACGWTLDGRNLSAIMINSGAAATSEPNLVSSSWGGDVLTGETKLPVFYDSSKCNFTVAGAISGAGLDVWTQWRGGYNFNLTGAANTFTNGLTVRGQNSDADKLGNLYVYANGALPPAGGPLALTDATVTFKMLGTCTLPPLVADKVTAVNDGQGAWNSSVTKTGTGDLTWNSLLGSDVLDVRQGNVLVKDRSGDRTQLAGLVEGNLLFRSDTWYAQVAYGTTQTNHAARSMAALYDRSHSFWTTDFPADMTRRTCNYWGYVWNNDPTNVTYSFAVYVGTHAHLNVGAFAQGRDDTPAQAGAHYYNYNTPMIYTLELSPGATPIQLSIYYDGSCGLKKACTQDGFNWQADFGAGYKLGAATSNSADYAKIEDLGDGSRFTWTLPEQVVENVTKIPGTETVIRRSPYFATMKFAAGTGVTFERGWYAVPTLEGLPTVSGITGALTVTSTFRFSARDAVLGNKLMTSGTFALGENAQIVIDDPGGSARRQRGGAKCFVLVEAAETVLMPDSVTVAGDTEWWTVERSADGKKLLLVYKPKGLVLIVL